MHTETVSAAFISHVVTTAGKYGCDSDALLNPVGLSRELLSDPALHIPAQKLREIYRMAVEHSGIPHFGLLVGASVRPGSFSSFGYVAMTSATLGDALNMLLRFNKTVFDSPAVSPNFYITDDVAILEQSRDNSGSSQFDVSLEATLACFFSFGRWLVGSDLPLEAVHMRRDAPVETAVYDRFFGCPVHFCSNMNALVFKASKLQMPVEGADRRMHYKLIREAELQLGHVNASFPVTRRLRGMMVEQMPMRPVRLESLAQDLAMSPRTLQRKLASEGQHFSSLFESVRMELAELYLKNPSLTITEIAIMLGFSDISSFSRAFREMYAMSPSSYRQRHSSH